MLPKLRFLAVLILLVSLKTLSGQVLIHKNLNIEDGLVYSQILMIHEDQRGFMWFGTSSGISRWDGVSFKNFILPKGLADNNCKWIVEFKDSTLVFATRKGIVQYKENKFLPIVNTPAALNHWIHSMLVAADNRLYIATDISGLWIYDEENFVHMDSSDGLPSNSIHALARAADGHVYVGFTANTIVKYKDGKIQKSLDLQRIPDGLTVNTLYEDENGALWIGTEEDGIYVYYNGYITHINARDGLPGSSIHHITAGEERQVYIATEQGLVIIENYQQVSVINEQNGLSNNFVWFIKKDRNNMYYIGTDGGGVDIYRPGLFQTLNSNSGLPDNTVWSICETKRHTFYFATDAGLAHYKNGDFNIIDTSRGLNDNMVLCLFEARDGKVYAGTNEQGVDVIDNNYISHINDKNGLDGPSVWTITQDNDGLVYFGTYDCGINVWDGRQIIDTINVNDGLSSNAVVSSFCASDGALYFGTDGAGVNRYVNGRIDTVLLNGNTIWSVYEDQLGNMYYGTNDRGLIFFREGKWDTLNIDDGLSHNSILGILEDDSGKFYLTADNGLNVINFNKNGCGIRVLGKNDGLASNECNQGAYFKDSQGYLWFGTIAGVSRFDPALCKPNANAPRVHFRHIHLFEKEISTQAFKKKYFFEYNENYFKFEFIGIDLSAPHKVQYSYRLSGIDKEWQSTTNTSVQYTNLNDGLYTFEIKAANEWGYWSDPQQLRFSIMPPFWERWWFIISSFIIIISPLVVVIRQRINRLLALERLRTKIAADLHDDIGAGLSEINILSAVAVSKTPHQIKEVVEPELNRIGSTARSLIDSMSDIVWLVNPEKDAVSDLVSRLKDTFNDLFEAKGILFSTENTQALQKIHLEMEKRHNLYLILKEAIHNAIKYSDCRQIHLKINLIGKKLCIRIKDDGKGFDITGVKRGNGLRNMQKRAEKLAGVLTINSAVNGGCEITFLGKM